MHITTTSQSYNQISCHISFIWHHTISLHATPRTGQMALISHHIRIRSRLYQTHPTDTTPYHDISHLYHAISVSCQFTFISHHTTPISHHMTLIPHNLYYATSVSYSHSYHTICPHYSLQAHVMVYHTHITSYNLDFISHSHYTVSHLYDIISHLHNGRVKMADIRV